MPKEQYREENRNDALDASEARRVRENFKGLRDKLLQLSRSNPMLNYKPADNSRRQIRFVDESLQAVYQRLVYDDKELAVAALPEPADIPKDEQNEEFDAQIAYLRATDVEYRAALQGIENSARDDDFELRKLERLLRDRLREERGMPPRAKRKELNRVEHAREHGIDPNYELPRAAPTQGVVRLQSMMLGERLQARMGAIHDLARISEQEMGFSTLFLAFGFLEWYDAEESGDANFAPLILLPVRLTARPEGGRKSYTLKATSEEAVANVTLARKLQQFSRTLGAFEPDENADDPVADYLDGVERAVQGLPNWKVRRFLVLGHFSFGRLAMYQDLDPDAWDLDQELLASGVLRGALTVDREETGDITGKSVDYEIDTPEIEHAAPFLVHDADASQHSAVVDVMCRHDLVISGPPGTGKSQTITNIIANVLARGDATVLFVSEKLAALEVVKGRLESAGLGEFCLELHADKSSPKAVVDSLKERVAVDPNVVDDSNASRMALSNAKAALKDYLTDLHAEDAGGSAPFELMWGSLELDRLNGPLPSHLAKVALPEEVLDDADRQLWLFEEVDKAAAVAAEFERRFVPLARSPWREFGFDASPSQHAEALAAVTRLRDAVREAVLVEQEAEGVGLAFDDRRWPEAVRGLPAPPAMQGSERLLDIELQAGLDAAFEVRNLREIEAGIAADPLSRQLQGDRLAAAERFAPLADDDSLSPSEALRNARTDLEAAERLLRDIEETRELRCLLGIEESAPLLLLQTTWAAADIAAQVSEDYRDWLPVVASLDAATLRAAHETWSGLKQADAELRRKYPGFGAGIILHPGHLREVADLLDNKLARLKFWDREPLARARAIAVRLGIGEDTSDGLRTLARHVQAMEAFDADPKHAAAAGSQWNGMETPFDHLVYAVELKNFVQGAFRPFREGARIAERVLSLDRADWDALARFQVLARQRLAVAEDVAREAVAIAEGKSRALKVADRARSLLASPDATSMRDVTAPMLQILGLVRLQKDRAALVQRLSARPESRALLGFVHHGREADDAIAQFRWIEAVRAAGLPTAVERGLLSAAAVERQKALVDLAARVEAARGDEGAERAMGTRRFGMCLPQRPRDRLLESLDEAVSSGGQLREYLSVLLARRELVNAGLASFLAALDADEAPTQRHAALLRQIVVRQRAERALRGSRVLNSASGTLLAHNRGTFRRQDKLKIAQDRLAVRRELLRRRPRPGSARGRTKEWTEMALISNEMNKQRSFLSVRALLKQAGQSIRALKPCFMMSPMTVSKFLPRDMKFDVVVIDEASQMRPEDALGALLRARQIVVVGDAQQMPPSSFFDRAMGDSDLDGDEGDMDGQNDESILEACGKAFDRVRDLKWHYRSRCESLIHFSNGEFYGDSLITFPSARPGSFSIDLIRVKGTYQAGLNAAEAQRVSEEAIALMQSLAEAPDSEFRTMVVVAMNQKQRETIRDQIERVVDPLVARYRERCEARNEPFQVMNLENVQGHERDIVLISMTYGPGPNRAVVDQRFGPIIKSQGHRRLNVLFTRARRRIGLFASMASSDIRDTGSPNRGARVLKSYLGYVERHGAAAGEHTGRSPDSPFEREVAERLRTRGFEVDPQVGVSGFRIDLGIRHRAQPTLYVAGVECDGAAYHSSRSARDRDRLREEVLADLGWRLVRVWSTDWFSDPDRETDRLVCALEALEVQPARTSDVALFRTSEAPADGGETHPVGPEAHAGASGQSDPAASLQGPDQPIPDPPGLTLLNGQAPLSEDQARLALEALRRTVIEADHPEVRPEASILRETMIDCFVSIRFDDPDDWLKRVPMYLRQRTDPGQRKYLGQICDVLQRMAPTHP